MKSAIPFNRFLLGGILLSIFILTLPLNSHAWSGEKWGNITRATIEATANTMMKNSWSPKNTIKNFGYGSTYHTFYRGRTYTGTAYSQNNPQESWNEFLNMVKKTNGGTTGYGNDCSGFASIAWKLPSRYTTYTFKSDAVKSGGYVSSLGASGSGQNAGLQLGDALNKRNSHIILFKKRTSGGVISMEQTPWNARSREWSWAQLSQYRPIRRNKITSGGTKENYLVGDWDGDGRDNLAVRRGNRILMDTDFDTTHNIEQVFGRGDSEDQYLVGDWDRDGRDNIAVRRGNRILMDTDFDTKHDLEVVFGKGNSEDEYFVIKNAVTGVDSVGVRRGNHLYIARGTGAGPVADETYYGTGNSEDQYLFADWQGQGWDNLAVRRGNRILIDLGFDGKHDWTLVYGKGNAEDEYFVGDWDGDGKDNLAVRRGNRVLMDIDFDGKHDITQIYGRQQ